ncbi:MAG: DUF4258 domain-containing protein [Nitrospinae bacterium]|nr:DUF4258 domain-containing protein [Nitrospinota bacterium]
MSNNWEIKRIVFARHALTQIFKRSISIDEVEAVISHYEIVAEYPDDTPFPSRLVLGFVEQKPLHVVLGYDEKDKIGYVVTAYRPDSSQWEPSFIRKRKP